LPILEFLPYLCTRLWYFNRRLAVTDYWWRRYESRLEVISLKADWFVLRLELLVSSQATYTKH